MMIDAFLTQTRELVDGWLDQVLPTEESEPAELHRAMRYSVFAGGKRLRPIMAVLAAGLFAGEPETVRLPACSLEMIHTYSLVHDDLPAMDNDDLRRGKPTCHKAFGEDMAILAGDALLTEAFRILYGLDPVVLKPVLQEIAAASSTAGMIGGQVLDVQCTGKKINLEYLRRMHLMKTGALLSAPLVVGGICAGAGGDSIESLRNIGRKAGLLFQITDDILDESGDEKELGKPVGSDREKDKATYVSIMGSDRAERFADETREECMELISSFHCERSEFRDLLAGLIRFIHDRRN